LFPVESAAISTWRKLPHRGNQTRRSLIPYGQNEGLRDQSHRPTLSKRFRAMRQRKAASMSAEELKRKLRNFPAAKLSERLAA
jgi:hypothetical protein